ncbi:hypothetical protein [Nocardioides stalactiti]|nr:hypothetical protein [Nocardioides stalactiti]
MAPEWHRPVELVRLVEALRRTEPRPRRRWSDLLSDVRRAKTDGFWSS